MGYRGKVHEQKCARELRAESWTLEQIADELGVAKSSVSLWVRDVEFTPRGRAARHADGRPMRFSAASGRRSMPSSPKDAHVSGNSRSATCWSRVSRSTPGRDPSATDW